MKVLFYPMLPDFRKSIAFWKVPRLRAFVLQQHIDEEKYAAVVELYWQRKADVSGEKSVPVPLCSPQISHGLAWDRTHGSAMRGGRLTAWFMTRPPYFGDPLFESWYWYCLLACVSRQRYTPSLLVRPCTLAVTVDNERDRLERDQVWGMLIPNTCHGCVSNLVRFCVVITRPVPAIATRCRVCLILIKSQDVSN